MDVCMGMDIDTHMDMNDDMGIDMDSCMDMGKVMSKEKCRLEQVDEAITRLDTYGQYDLQ